MILLVSFLVFFKFIYSKRSIPYKHIPRIRCGSDKKLLLFETENILLYLPAYAVYYKNRVLTNIRRKCILNPHILGLVHLVLVYVLIHGSNSSLIGSMLTPLPLSKYDIPVSCNGLGFEEYVLPSSSNNLITTILDSQNNA